MFLGFPDPDPSLFVRSGSGSGSFHEQAKKSKKNLEFYYFVTSFDFFLSLKTDVIVPSESNKQNFFLLVFCWRLEDQ